MHLWGEFAKGVWRENPIFVLVLGMCPTLAVTTSVKNGLGMGVATTFVLAGSNAVISAVRRAVPADVRIPCYIVVIAAFVSVVEMAMAAYAPAEINRSLGIFIPLIVVNCIVMGRAEAFASRHGLAASIVDGLGMGLGFTLALALLGGVREFGASGTLLDVQIVPGWTPDCQLLKLAPGAFIVLGLLLALRNWRERALALRDGRPPRPTEDFGCDRCCRCKLSPEARRTAPEV